MKLPREFYIPKGAICVRDKQSSAVAYLYTTKRGSPAAAMFAGKRAKPDRHFAFRSEAGREKEISGYFASIRLSERARAERAEKRKAFRNPYKVGDLFKASWGYDQTNVDYYEVVAVRGSMLEVREIGTDSEEDGFMTGKCVPLPGHYVGEAFRVRAQGGYIRVEGHYASYQAPKLIGGVPTYAPAHWSNYA